MSFRSSVTSTPDVNRIALAVSRPGIDPRTWNCMAYVVAFKIDKEGPFVDVALMPSEAPETARVGADYAGPGFGVYYPLEKDTEVSVGFPNGDPNEGLVILRRFWSKSDPPPQLAQDNPTDVLIIAKSGANIRIVTQGGGTVMIQDVDGTAVELALKTDVAEIVSALANAATATGAPDSGLAFKTAIDTALALSRTPTGTTVLKGQ